MALGGNHLHEERVRIEREFQRDRLHELDDQIRLGFGEPLAPEGVEEPGLLVPEQAGNAVVAVEFQPADEVFTQTLDRQREVCEPRAEELLGRRFGGLSVKVARDGRL